MKLYLFDDICYQLNFIFFLLTETTLLKFKLNVEFIIEFLKNIFDEVIINNSAYVMNIKLIISKKAVI